MRDERSCRGAARVFDEHRRLDFHEVAAGKKCTDLLNDSGSHLEGLANIFIHNEIDISLTIAGICICQSVELLRKGFQRFGQQCQFLDMHRDFSGLCTERKTLHTDDVTDIQLFKAGISIIAQVVAADINLNPSVAVLQVGKRSFTHYTLEHHTAGNRNSRGLLRIITLGVLLSAKIFKLVFDLLRMVGLVVSCNLERIFSLCLKRGQFLHSDLFQLSRIL